MSYFKKARFLITVCFICLLSLKAICNVIKKRKKEKKCLEINLISILLQDTGLIYLLNKSGPIFEELENHQVSLQAMQSSAGSFLDDIIKWQKKLQQIEAVLVMWLEVQDKWIELEEVLLMNMLSLR